MLKLSSIYVFPKLGERNNMIPVPEPLLTTVPGMDYISQKSKLPYVFVRSDRVSNTGTH